MLKGYNKDKVPHFFIEAKQKTKKQVAPINQSCVNRIRGLMPNVRLNFNWDSCGKFDWRMLTSSTLIPNNEVTKKIIDTYKRRSSRMNFRFDGETDEKNKFYLCEQLREDLLAIHPDPDFVCDVLVKALFGKNSSKRKTVFWQCFGNEVLQHLSKNVDQNQTMCIHCGKRFYKESKNQIRCNACAKKQWAQYNKMKKKEYYRKKKCVYS